MNGKIFVYGSLMEGFFNCHKCLKGKIIDRKPARTKGKLYHLNNKGYPAMVSGNDYVYGELITICDFKNAVIELDKLEKFYEKNNIENSYNRTPKEIEVYEEGSVEIIDVYMYNENNPNFINDNMTYIADGDWRKYMENNSKLIVNNV